MKKLIFIMLMMPLMLLGQVVFNNEISGEITSTFWEQILGNIPLNTYLAGGVFIAIGILISWFYKAKQGQRNNINTPYTFSWKLFLFSKLPRKIMSIIVNILVGFVAMKFTNELLGMELTMFLCLVIGITFDVIVVKISKLRLPIK
jgi:Mlc titration factor MtfA (ptsG expression regulator)